MKSLALFILSVLVTLSAYTQDITGQWNGVLSIQGQQLRLVLHVVRADTGYTATVDSPDQGAKGIPVTTVTFKDPVFRFGIANLHLEYSGELKGGVITGIFKQGGFSAPMDLSREAVEKKSVVRPQEPAKPYPYHSEDVTFENKKDNITLAGTLTLPAKEGLFPVVVLISGSGPQNRDEEVMGHKPFLVLADHLTRNGIAVLRYDDRGTAGSKGNFATATSEDFATDVEAAIQYLQTRREIHKKKIGLVGHSEGGMIAPLVASRNKDVAFIVLLSGPGVPGDQLLLLQTEKLARASGADDAAVQKVKEINNGAYALVAHTANTEALQAALTAYLQQQIKDEDQLKAQVAQMTSPWMRYFLRYNPVPVLQKVKVPVLALNGEKDLQVPAQENLEGIRKALAKNKNATVKELPGLNHLFQEAKTGLPQEYGTLEQTFSPAALTEISSWIGRQTQ